MSRAILVIAILICLSGCERAPAEGRLVYEALFDSMRALHPPFSVFAESVVPRGPGADTAELMDYDFHTNDVDYESDDFGAVDVRLIHESEYAEIFSSAAQCQGNWEQLVDQYGDGGLVRLSGVGFSADASRAVVYIEAASNCSWVGGFLMHFEKGETWQLTETEEVWRGFA